MDNSEIRKRTVALLKKKRVAIPEHLPLFDEGLSLRTEKETIDRILCLHVVGACAYGFNRKRARKWLATEGLESSLTQPERAFVESGRRNAATFKIRIEGLWALVWSVNLTPSFEFDKPCSDRLVYLLPDLKIDEPSESVRARAKQRPIEEILCQCDLAYCLHWALRQSEITGKKFRIGIEPYDITERRRAFEWLISDDDWEDISLDT